MRRALVLSGGGTSGTSRETGELKGLCDGGVDLTQPDLVVGTWAGAAAAAAYTQGAALAVTARERPF